MCLGFVLLCSPPAFNQGSKYQKLASCKMEPTLAVMVTAREGSVETHPALVEGDGE